MANADPKVYQVIPSCPVCGGRMELVYDRPTTSVGVCVDCHSAIHVPARAWAVILARSPKKAPHHPGR